MLTQYTFMMAALPKPLFDFICVYNQHGPKEAIDTGLLIDPLDTVMAQRLQALLQSCDCNQVTANVWT